ncbi:hypothetical protein GC722_05310 [Auraticoccus sp. F435]|uniref:Uncharacterized protein n=1 Tax=Auraticoccus cholistanensis TaxID=2656650 RepID=A0A6A9US75_9ACTN|nr:hypothetical protein [Auraticoccus cholistanensis]MVA75448.1 hypothetical protein [Auraticoccus cholistanensis]
MVYTFFAVIVLLLIAAVNLWLSDDAGRSASTRQLHKLVAGLCAVAAVGLLAWVFLSPVLGAGSPA